MPRRHKSTRNSIERAADLKEANERKKQIAESSQKQQRKRELINANILGKKSRWTPGTRIIVLQSTSAATCYLMCAAVKKR
jgi:hypothetical protein